jgi:hypothetical protein
LLLDGLEAKRGAKREPNDCRLRGEAKSLESLLRRAGRIMTAEVAVLNRSAVALSADSAVTISPSTKVYKTVNKLFALSKFQPVGIMIYGGADYMSVPWETIIKLYREARQKKEFPTVSEYAVDFRAFVQGNVPITEEDQKRRVRQIWIELFSNINRRVRLNLLAAHPKDQRAAAAIFLATVKDELAKIASMAPVALYSAIKAGAIITRYANELRAAIASNFRGRTFTPAITKALAQCAELSILRDDFRFGESGLVIAGFGGNELFPALCASAWSGIVADVLRVREESPTLIGPKEDQRAALLAFAQREMVFRFMEGVDPNYLEFLEGGIKQVVHLVSDHLIDRYSSGNSRTKKQRAARVRVTVDKMVNAFSSASEEFRYKMFSEKMLDIVSILPKEEIGELAGSLVEITSLKRRMSMDAESVGGPIDVAVISKGDGFIWIKRKHYFNSELNPFFMRRYIMAEEAQQTIGGIGHGTGQP